jgi:hypothetical protein
MFRGMAVEQVSQTADLIAITWTIPLACFREQLGGGLRTLMRTTPVPLFENPMKQELPQPASARIRKSTAQSDVWPK